MLQSIATGAVLGGQALHGAVVRGRTEWGTCLLTCLSQQPCRAALFTRSYGLNGSPHPFVTQFWSEARPDWYALYAQRLPLAQRQQLQQEEGQDEERGGSGGGESRGTSGGNGSGDIWEPPRFSATSFLCKWQAARQALTEARLRKRQRREAWLLQQYGGVKPELAEGQQLLENGGGASCSHAGCASCQSAQHSGHPHA